MNSRTFSTDLDAAINELPTPVGGFFRRLLANPRFRCKPGRMQMQIWLDDEKIGGLNGAHSHWYISQIFAKRFDGIRILEECGFEFVVHNVSHAYWKAQGINSFGKFQNALQRLTGIQL